MIRKRFVSLSCLLASLLAAPSWAGNGATLHGVGAVNDSMGGAGVALPNDALGALDNNPALLAKLSGHRMEFSTEYAKAKNAVESTVSGPGFSVSGRTNEDGKPAVVPAFAWTHHSSTSSVAYGMGFLGLAGFGVDYPQDASNPILAPQPRGFGRVFSSYTLLKIPFAFAWQATPTLAVGLAFDAARASLESDPAGFAAPDCTVGLGGGTCFVPHVNIDSEFGYGGQVGILWEVTPAFNIGASYASKISFSSFEWNSAHANPLRADFGTARRLRFKVDAPATAIVGIGLKLTPNLQVALDAKRLAYGDAAGFGGTGFDSQGNANGLGWKNITVLAAGVEWRPGPKLALRAGYNRSENPIPDNLTFQNVIAPAIFRNHACLGLGYRLYANLEANLALYRAFKNTASGPFLGPTGPVPGTQVKQEMTLDSGVLTFSFRL
ncbi:MAG TPA: outer membrane protein transport protein [Thermoanaerobaculia bacterium]